MAWSWSHTAEAYEHARERLFKMSKTRLAVIWAEWKTHQKAQADKLEEAQKEARENEWTEPGPDDVTECTYFDQDCYETSLKEAKAIIERVGKDALAEDIWTWACVYATCDNGGHRLWMCPYGCQVHSVST